ncbi:MAG: prolyl oligopeptidase family serine peptidase [Calditrichaceae bacterium]
MSRFSLLIFLVFLMIAGISAQKAAFKLDDLYKITGVGDPQISPDGKRIAFVTSKNNLKDGTSNSEIYIMESDGKNLRQLTDDPASDNHPRWSSNSRNLLFVSTRENGSQAWILNVENGESKKLTDLAIGVSNPEWLSPDRIIFSADVYPECGADDECNKVSDSTLTNGPLQAHMADHLLYRHWTTYKDGKRTHLFAFDLSSSELIDLTPGDFDSPAFGGGFSVSPDGKEICVESNRESNEAETTNKDLWIIDAETGGTKNITAANKAYDGQPVYSPDGSYIAYMMQKVPVFESDLRRLAVYDRQKQTIRVLSESTDNWIGTFDWAPDSKSVYFTIHEKGHFPLYNVELKSGKIKKIIDLKTIDAIAVSKNNKWLAAIRRSIAEPAELYKVLVNGKSERLSFFNQEIEETVDLRPGEEMWIGSPTGKKIHTFIIKPHNFDPAKKYPLILNVHGGPQYQWYDGFRGDWQMYPGSGYIVAFPNPHGSSGYGQEFTTAISKDWGGKVYQDIMAVTDSLANLHFVDANRMGAMGWSYGGYMMMWLEGHTTRFKALASMMGLYNLPAFYGATEELWFPEWDLGGTPWESESYGRWSPNNFVKNFKTPCLVITGERDYRVPYTQSLEFFTALQKMGVESRLIVFKNDGHWPSHVKSMPFYYNAHLDWFHKYLGGDPAPYDMNKMWRNQAFE